MLHARNDYNERIQDEANLIPEDEPVFLLRGQDKWAPAVVAYYAKLVEAAPGHCVAIARNAKEHAEAMRKWQGENETKAPDMKEEDSLYPAHKADS